MPRKNKILTETEDEFARKVMQGQPASLSRKGDMMRRRPNFKHYNADGFSHVSLSAAFRRYGKRN